MNPESSYYIPQTLLFLTPETLDGEKLDVYCLGKMLKYFTGADVTSYKVKCKSVFNNKTKYFGLSLSDEERAEGVVRDT